MRNVLIICIFANVLILLIGFSYLNQLYDTNNKYYLRDQVSRSDNSLISEIKTRDFMSKTCLNRKRIGGRPFYVKNAPDPLWRIDGAWFVCFDGNLKPKNNSCNLISLGISNECSFDKEMNSVYGCNVHSFDPFKEADLFKNIRESDKSLENSTILKVNDKWKFYRLGIKSGKTDLNSLKIKDMIGFKSMLKLIKLENEVIDVLKVDIEGAEKGLIAELDMDYICKYIKQFVFETHLNMNFKELIKLEQCFRLFHRNTRFFRGDIASPLIGHLTEFQNPNGFKLEIKDFRDELHIAEHMFVNGELYFLNKNFLIN